MYINKSNNLAKYYLNKDIFGRCVLPFFRLTPCLTMANTRKSLVTGLSHVVLQPSLKDGGNFCPSQNIKLLILAF